MTESPFDLAQIYRFLRSKSIPTNRIAMRQIRDALRLHMQSGLSYTKSDRALEISKIAAGKYVSVARTADVDWDIAQML